MGQKVHPVGIRLGIVKDHTSVWYADGKTYADYLFADLKVREECTGLACRRDTRTERGFLRARIRAMNIWCLQRRAANTVARSFAN